MRLDFIRGHMGGNTIILLQGDQIPAGKELEIAVKLLGPNYLCAHEAGILYPTGIDGQVKVKIVEPTLPCFISACGGLTQVLGAALIETELGSLFRVDKGNPCSEVALYTDGGLTLLEIEHENSKTRLVKTNMKSCVKECYEHGVEKLFIADLEVMRSGKFMVIDADIIKATVPEADFVSWNQDAKELLKELQSNFMTLTGEVEPNVTIFDWHPEHNGDLRAVYPHYIEDDFYEPSCGTGSVALGLALQAWGKLDSFKVEESNIDFSLRLETGGGRELGGPDLTTVELRSNLEKVSSAAFSHSRVEITAVGEARI